MKIGMIGAGKLGLPVALTIEDKGHEVEVYDVNPAIKSYLADRKIPYREEGLQPLLDKTKIRAVDSIAELVRGKDIVFCAIQTPHDPKFEGSTIIPHERKDFDYTYLLKAIEEVVATGEQVTLAVISTCLPGTFRREILPILEDNVEYVYVPQFIAMGTVMADYLEPEFNLIGVHHESAAAKLEEFYKTINDAPNVITDITTAEGIKVSYNTWVTAKTVIANAWGELAQRLGMNFNDLFRAWSLSTKRILSPKYMQAGMSDGGGCHPRDNIALSFIARKSGMSHDIWEDLMLARQDHEAWHASFAVAMSKDHHLPLVLLGRAFKPETDIQTGSPALLMASFIRAADYPFEHLEDIVYPAGLVPSVFFLATAHDRYRQAPYPVGSIVIDPFRMMPDIEGVKVVRIGDEPK